MASVERLLAQHRAEVETRGEDWLQETLGPVLSVPATECMAARREAVRARSRPPERYSPGPSPRAQKHSGSPPQAPPAKRIAGVGGCREESPTRSELGGRPFW